MDSTEAAAAALAENAASAGLRTEILDLALRAHARVRKAGRTSSPILTVIDYGLPSRERRLWVLDTEKGTVLERELVAHGNRTGGDIASVFSNRAGSNQSSLGTFVTGKTYFGKHGKSLRLHGLDDGLNDRAFERAIVIHGADYVNEGIIGQLGRLGRSQGCPALSPEASARIIDLIKDGSVVFSYHPSASAKLETLLAG
ncbi:MAG TPA: murein L,D-transpeptidase catalytic domain family protein [Gemmatimonadales bacterium]|nr:murein L,D-transpeptidase catalytic domain family protein [Gemmatimonadales bacterium]